VRSALVIELEQTMHKTVTLALALATGLLVIVAIHDGALAAMKGAERGIIIVNSKPGGKGLNAGMGNLSQPDKTVAKNRKGSAPRLGAPPDPDKWYTPGAAKRAPALGGPDTKIKK
jgi:hypothetical protein